MICNFQKTPWLMQNQIKSKSNRINICDKYKWFRVFISSWLILEATSKWQFNTTNSRAKQRAKSRPNLSTKSGISQCQLTGNFTLDWPLLLGSIWQVVLERYQYLPWSKILDITLQDHKSIKYLMFSNVLQLRETYRLHYGHLRHNLASLVILVLKRTKIFKPILKLLSK